MNGVDAVPFNNPVLYQPHHQFRPSLPLSLHPVKVGMVEEGGRDGGVALSDAGMEIACWATKRNGRRELKT